MSGGRNVLVGCAIAFAVVAGLLLACGIGSFFIARKTAHEVGGILNQVKVQLNDATLSQAQHVSKAIQAYAKAHHGKWPNDADAHTLTDYMKETDDLKGFKYEKPKQAKVGDTPPDQVIGTIDTGPAKARVYANGRVTMNRDSANIHINVDSSN